MFEWFAMSAGISCTDAQAIADRALNHATLNRDVAIEVVVQLDIATEGKCNLPGIEPDGDV